MTIPETSSARKVSETFLAGNGGWLPLTPPLNRALTESEVISVRKERARRA